MLSSQFKDHLQGLDFIYCNALAVLGRSGVQADAVLIHSGFEQFYYSDDRAIPFRPFGHFSHWLPVTRPDQMVLVKPGSRPVYFQVIPDDFWYEQTIENASWWSDQFEIITLTDSAQVAANLATQKNLAFLGENIHFAVSLGIDAERVNPPVLLHYLDYHRALKSDYEISQLRAANQQALIGHEAARRRFESGGSEYAIHNAYLQACNILEEETPYTNIIGLDEKSAILHYQHKRRDSGDGKGRKTQVLLIDAGCKVNGYGSDITRTSVRAHTRDEFRQLLKSMEALELSLLDLISPGLPYPKLHEAAHRGVAGILHEHRIVDASIEEIIKQGIQTIFMPHGVGHLLGLQVHDVGGHQKNPAGERLPPPEHSPALRNTRVMEQRMVFTVEPGFYFIPSLLNRERQSSRGKLFNWPLIDALIPCGGIRVEDNVQVTTDGFINLTRG
jgi:Xaa-Pro dipeptidase